MKKIFAVLLACAMLISVLSACSSHSHTESGNWLADTTGHWKACDGCDEKLQSGEHTLNDESKCTVCGSEITDWGDSISVSTYDEQENIIRMAEYDADGKLLTETVYEYEYDSDGNLKKSKETIDGRLSSETEYTVSDGESIEAKYTQYNEDGSYFINEYDSNGNVIKMIDYDAEGNVTLQTDCEYAQNGDGEWYEVSRTEVYADGTKIEAEYNEQGDNTARTVYDADGNETSNETWEYTYDDNGFKATEKAYENGKLKEEKIYKTIVKDDEMSNYAETVINYNEDGSKTVCVYNENDELVSETNDKASSITEDDAIQLVKAELGDDFAYIPADELIELEGKEYYCIYVKQLTEAGNYTTMTTYYVSTDGLKVFDKYAE